MCLETPLSFQGREANSRITTNPCSPHLLPQCKTKTPLKCFFQKYKSTEKTPGNIEAPTKQNEQDQIDTAAAHIEI